MFKPGDKVICCDDKGTILILHKEYEVLVASWALPVPYVTVTEHPSNKYDITRFTVTSQQLPLPTLPPNMPIGTGGSGSNTMENWSCTPIIHYPSKSATIKEFNACPIIAKCECGTDKIGGGKHSSYCPKSNIA